MMLSAVSLLVFNINELETAVIGGSFLLDESFKVFSQLIRG